jgi:hypothetical protein
MRWLTHSLLACAFLWNGCGKDEKTIPTDDGSNPCSGFVPPQVSSSGMTAIGDTVMLFAASALPGVTYEWTGPASFTASTQNPLLESFQYRQSGYYRARVRDGSCISGYDSVRVAAAVPCPAMNANTASVGSATWYFYSNVTAGPLGPNLYYGITATSSYGKLYIQFNRYSPPDNFNTFTISQIPGVDTMAVSMRIDEGGTLYEATGGTLYAGDEGDSTVFTFCGVNFQATGGPPINVKAYLIRS